MMDVWTGRILQALRDAETLEEARGQIAAIFEEYQEAWREAWRSMTGNPLPRSA